MTSAIARMPAGEYFIGDLCYVLDGSWDAVCNAIINGNSVQNGAFMLPDGRAFVVFSTAYGDGTYEDEYGNTYPVDAGIIGAIETKNMDIAVTPGISELGTLTEFTEEWTAIGDNGLLNFGDKFEIDTRD